MKKKDNLWQLLKRLDEEAGQFNLHLHQANHYFDTAARSTNNILDKQEKKLHKLIGKVKISLRSFMKKKKGRKK